MATVKKTTKPKVARAPKAVAPTPGEATIYNQQGKAVGSIALPERLFAAKWNPDLVHQAVTVMEANARIPYAHTKDRGEVRGGGRKPWQQKGTGRARHGSIRSPLWRGGGVTFGPRKERNFSRGLNKKMRTQALFSALSRKMKDGEIIFINKLTFAAPKTAEAKKTIHALSGVSGFEKLATKQKNTLFLAQATRDLNVEKSFRNFGNVSVGEVRNLNPREVLQYGYLAILDPELSLPTLEKKGQAKK